ncbi:MAG: ABC transporter permease subunit [Tissierellia bacterium]|nr:ABC transporter permease subunit [Tissierellia bacterium]
MSTSKATENNNKKNKKSFSSLLFGNLFGSKKELSILEEEQVQSPWRTVIRTFRSNKVSMTGLIVFLLIFATVMIGPLIKPVDLSFSETSQKDIAPGFDMMKVPQELQGKIADIAIGPTFSIGVSTDGKVYIWGKTRITSAIDVRNLPRDEKTKQLIDMGKVVKVAAGTDHVLALNEDGQVFAWGNGRQGQTTLPYELDFVNVKDIFAGYQLSIVVTEDGRTIHFGSSMINDYNEFHPYQGQIEKVTMTQDAVIGLTYDGEVVYLGSQVNAYSTIPENMGKVVDIASTAATVAAVNDEGKVFIWGNVTASKGEGNVPETDSKIVSIQGGRFHYTAMTEDGKVYAWGANYYNQANVPQKLQNATVKQLFTGAYQNYAITEDNQLVTWGLKGYLMGTDDLGRDIFTRLLNGGRMSMTIGAVAVIISTIIGIIIGSLSGFFGGKLDLVLQRISEVISSLPFLPFAMILSSIIGNSMDSNQRIVLIMVILGLLSWPGLQRLVRAQVLSVREQEYVIAAKSLGIKQSAIIFKHILPNVVSIILVSATLSFATSMLTEASLSYLGFGVQAPHPTWGNMLYGANNSIVIQNYWWRWVFASIALGVCVICINVIGDGLRDAVDPKSHER